MYFTCELGYIIFCYINQEVTCTSCFYFLFFPTNEMFPSLLLSVQNIHFISCTALGNEVIIFYDFSMIGNEIIFPLPLV